MSKYFTVPNPVCLLNTTCNSHTQYVAVGPPYLYDNLYNIYIWLLVQVLPLYMITYMIQEFLLVSWHCVSRTLQTRSSPPLRNAGEWWIYESQTPKLYTVRSKWMPGCLETPSKETNSKIEQKLWSSYGLASHTDRRGRAHVCYLTTQTRQVWAFLSKTAQVRRDDSCLDWTGQELLVLTCHGKRGNQEWTFSNSSLLHR